MKKRIIFFCAGLSGIYIFYFYFPFQDRIVVKNNTNAVLHAENKLDKGPVDIGDRDLYEKDGVVYIKGALPDELQSTHKNIETGNEELSEVVEKISRDIEGSSEGEVLVQKAELLLSKIYSDLGEDIPDVEKIIEQEVQNFDEDKNDDIRSFEDQIEADYEFVREDG